MSIAEKLQTIAENQQRVYSAGKVTEYDRFWDTYQNCGNRNNYKFAFAGEGWTLDSFKPKYNMEIIEAFEMFRGNLLAIDLAEHLNSLGVTLDFSKCSGTSIFYDARFTRIGTVEFSRGGITHAFYRCTNLKTVDKLIISGEDVIFTDWFSRCSALENILFEGVVGASISLGDSPMLSHESIISLLQALKEGGTGTVTLGTENLAKLTDAEKAIATEKGWTLV